MDVMIPYGIYFKKCGKKSYSGFKRNHIFPYLEKNLIDKNNESVMAIVAELHCSSYYQDINNFIIKYYSSYQFLSNITMAYFIDQNFRKIQGIKKTIPKSQHKNALINSNEIRNIYCSMFSQFLDNPTHNFSTKLEPKCYQEEYILRHSNMSKIVPIVDNNHSSLSDKLSRGVREILYWQNIQFDGLSGHLKKYINFENLEKIMYWINWTAKVEVMEKKLKNVSVMFESGYSSLKNIKPIFRCGWEFFIWDKIWQKCEKNQYVNKNLIKSYTNLFYYNYSRTKIKERAGLLAISVFVSNSPLKVKIERKISKFEVFASLNANEFYKNINIEPDNDDKYLEMYNLFNNIKTSDTKTNEKIYRQNKIERKMDFLKDYLPEVNSGQEEIEKNSKKISDYFSK